MSHTSHPIQHLSDVETQEDTNADNKNNNVSDNLCLSAEIENYNNLLKNYHVDLYRWLNNASSFKQFELRISEEMLQLGLTDWSFTLLDDVDHHPYLGNIKYNSISLTLTKIFSECDFLLQHAKVCDKPIYQSQVESFVRNAPFSSEIMERYLMLLAMIKQEGYLDIYCIPISDTKNKRRGVFCVSSKGMSTLDFKDKAEESKEMLKILGTVVSDVGGLKYGSCLRDMRTRYRQLIDLQPYSLLAAMVNYNLTEEEKLSGFSIYSIVQYIRKIRIKICQTYNNKHKY